MTPPDTEKLVEQAARAISVAKGLNPEALYQHNFEGDYPEDERRDYRDPFTGESRVQLFHRAWRHSVPVAMAAYDVFAAHIASLEETIARQRKAAMPFVRHYESWMENYGDDQEMSTFARVTFGQVRALRKEIK